LEIFKLKSIQNLATSMADEDVDNIDFANYKGIYAEDESE
jgi:hypothetical protein